MPTAPRSTLLVLAAAASTLAGCSPPRIDPTLAHYIAAIRVIDNHTHVRSTAPDDSDTDALPLDGIPPFPFPARLSPANPDWLAAYRALYGYRYDDFSDAHRAELRATMEKVRKEKGDSFNVWALDQIGTEIMVGNRIAMGPGLPESRFRWASYVDALMLPLATDSEMAATPDTRALYPLEVKLLRRYMTALRLTSLPPTLAGYLASVVTPTLENQRKAGCIAVKFEAAYLRALDFDTDDSSAAARIYARYASGGIPSHADYKTLEDVLFRRIAREAGRLGMAVHIHAFDGFGGFYRAAGSDPILLETALNDSTLRGTSFVILHGGGNAWPHTATMLWKPNVYADISMMTIIDPPSQLAQVLSMWLAQWPDKVLFGSDAFDSPPDAGWEVPAWLATNTARQALGLALTNMMRNGEVTRERAESLAVMVLRGNAARLYHLKP